MPATILVVDDELEFNSTIQDIFKQEIRQGDYNFKFATNGQEALAIASDPSSTIDLLLTDVRMPQMDGLTLIQQLGVSQFSPKIILISAYVSQKEVESFVENNPNILEFFTKANVDITQLRETVNLYLSPPLIEKVAFDYSDLDEDTSQFLQKQTTEIQHLAKLAAEAIVEVGERLIQVKEKLEHGQFQKWLEAELGWHYNSALNFMRVAKVFGPQKHKICVFDRAALYVLSTPSLPEAAREEALKQAEEGTKITYSVAKEIKEKYDKNTKGNKQGEQGNKPLSSLQGSRSRQKKREDLKAAKSSVTQPQTAAVTPSKNEILAIRRKEEWWQLGKHYLYRGDPNSPQFLEKLPPSIALTLAFPPVANWQLDRPIQAKSAIAFCSTYSDIVLDDLVRQYLLVTSESEDIAVFSFLPDPQLLLIGDELDLHCYVAEPDPHRCEAIITAWQEKGGKVNSLENDRSIAFSNSTP